jgi:hypothetical protein
MDNTEIVRSGQQAKFIRLYTWSEWAGNASMCAVKAGYSESTAKQIGYSLKRQFASNIATETQKLIGDSAALGLSGIVELAKHSLNPHVRLSACKDLLDRAGYTAINKIDLNSMDRKTDDELKEELKKLLSANIIDISPNVEKEGKKVKLEMQS